MRILTASEMRTCDEYTFRHIGVPSRAVMEVAGRSVAGAVLRLPREMISGGVTVFAGGGNNGGDGYVAARFLAEARVPVEVYAAFPPEKLTGDALSAYQAWHSGGGAIATLNQPGSNPVRRGLCVDALFGTGYSRPMEQDLAHLVDRINAARDEGALRTLALDIPSGVLADSGHVPNTAIRADGTVALQTLKPCHVLPPGRELCGEIFVAEIGVSLGGLRVGAPERHLLLPPAAKLLLQRIRRSSYVHKGTRGHVAVVGGFPGKTGAVLLAANAALRAGAGLVTALVPEAAFDALQPQLREVMGAALPIKKGETALRSAIRALLEGKDAVVAGPGLGTGDDSKLCLRILLEEGKRLQLPFLLDADALNLLAGDDALRRELPRGTILTPHPGEMARLRKNTISEIEAARLHEAGALAEELLATVVLKGPQTVIVGSDGEVRVSPHAHAVLATAGSGDVLSGIIGAFRGAGLEATDAAALGVFLHGEAGASLSRGVTGGAVGALAHEIADALPALSTLLLSWKDAERSPFFRKVLPSPSIGLHDGPL